MQDRSGVPLVGTTLPLVFPKGGRTPQPPVGSWVKFRNLGARVVQGQLQVCTVAAAGLGSTPASGVPWGRRVLAGMAQSAWSRMQAGSTLRPVGPPPSQQLAPC